MEEKDLLMNETEQRLTSQTLLLEQQVSELTRQLDDTNLELNEAQKSSEQLTQAEREIHEKRLNDANSSICKLKEQVEILEKANDEQRDMLDQTIAERNSLTNQFERKMKTTQESPSPGRQDSELLYTIRKYLEDILNNFTLENDARDRNSGLLEQLSNLQRKLNDVKRSEQEVRSSLRYDYENRLSSLQEQKDQQTRRITEMLKRQKQDSEQLSEDVTTETEKRNRKIEELNAVIQALESEKREVNDQLAERQRHIGLQNEYISKQRVELEKETAAVEDIKYKLAKSKSDIIESNDDNEILTVILDKCLEIKAKRSGVLDLRRINNEENKRNMALICKKYQIPYN